MTKRLYEDLSVFFACSVSIELEASERLRELAASMALHRDHELSELFEKLAKNCELQGALAENLSESLCIPNLRAWEHARPEGDFPKALDFAEIHHLMSAKDALETALSVEDKTERFYREIASNAEDKKIKGYATQFAAEVLNQIEKVKEKMLGLNNCADSGPGLSNHLSDSNSQKLPD